MKSAKETAFQIITEAKKSPHPHHDEINKAFETGGHPDREFHHSEDYHKLHRELGNHVIDHLEKVGYKHHSEGRGIDSTTSHTFKHPKRKGSVTIGEVPYYDHLASIKVNKD